MGSRGPIPKREAERMGHSKPEPPLDKVDAVGKVKPPTCPAGLHAEARGWYQSLAPSGQSQFYELSDWRRARVLAIILDQMLQAPSVSAALFAAWCSAESELGTTEGARRRMGIEIKRRAALKSVPAGPTVMDEYRDALGG